MQFMLTISTIYDDDEKIAKNVLTYYKDGSLAKQFGPGKVQFSTSKFLTSCECIETQNLGKDQTVSTNKIRKIHCVRCNCNDDCRCDRDG